MNTSRMTLAMWLMLLVAAGCTRVEGPPPPPADAPYPGTPAAPPQTEPPQTEPPQTEPAQTESPQTEPAQTESPANGAQVTVRVIDEEELSEVIAGYRGEVVLIDFWATWCIACVELFPHTVGLHERFAGDGLRVISVSFDQPESKPAVLDFLNQHGAVFDNFISRYGAGVESPEKFGLPGALPQLLLYDRRGELAHTFPEPRSAVDAEALDRAVEELLGIDP